MKKYVKEKIDKLPIRTKQILFGCMFACAACYCIYLLLTAFTVQHGPLIVFKTIQGPKHITSNGDENTKAVMIVTEHEFKQIEQFKNHIDSLRKTVTGNLIADSILHGRPGLMDSIEQLELLYHYQKQNK